MTELIYQLIQRVDDQFVETIMTEDNLIPAMDLRGFVCTGSVQNEKLRPELQGHPTFKGVAGPMYGGPRVVRYEDWKTYDLMSM